ncbi:MAG: zinc ABC transporter substrate-binding protein [Anaerolineae bacterium]|nr:MAG: zinc ABC transporter substrate-binding protein [Anaerolineae bacterium]
MKRPTSLLLLTAFLAACAAPTPAESGAFKVVASTTLVGDVAARVGGAHIQLVTLLPVGADPHSFEPSPQDLAALEDADLILLNGLGLEANLANILSAAPAPVVEVSDGITAREFESEEGHTEDDGHDHGLDPHVWMDPRNVAVWAVNIAAALADADPAHATDYRANAEAYAAELDALHNWIVEQVALIPTEDRVLVADHDSLGYFAATYGFDLAGTVTASFSTLAEPSAQELAALEDAIRAAGALAIFVDTTINPALAERIAADTGSQVVRLYSASLSEPGGPAATYIDLMRYNVSAMVAALK